jgi:hypothetical protein
MFQQILNEIRKNYVLQIVIVLACVYIYYLYTRKESLENVPFASAEFTSPTLQNIVDITNLQAQPSALPLPTNSSRVTTLPAQAAFSVDDAEKEKLAQIADGSSPLTAADLLPVYDSASLFAKENPVTEILKNKNFLISGYNLGVNTISQSNKIPYHDLRSLPPIVKTEVGPWMNSSFENSAAIYRRKLE